MYIGLRLVALLTVIFSVGCDTMPSHMRVAEGLSPTGQDKDVRFRTTYYFRTFDLCGDADSAKNDSLYRFRLTGKSNALTNKIRFESGTLLASQIDPFGAAIAFDKGNGQFYFKSQEQVRQDALRNEQFADFDRFFERYEKAIETLKTGGRSEEEIKEKVDKLETALTERLSSIDGPAGDPKSEDEYSENLSNLFDDLWIYLESKSKVPKDKYPNKPAKNRDNIAKLIKEEVDNQAEKVAFYERLAEALGKSGSNFYCDGNPQRGYQVLGPQGAQMYDQDSRLIFAMSSSGEPLINTLQELSGRVLNAGRQVDVDNLTLLVKEELAAEEALDGLDAFSVDSPDAAEKLIETARDRFKPAAPKVDDPAGDNQ